MANFPNLDRWFPWAASGAKQELAAARAELDVVCIKKDELRNERKELVAERDATVLKRRELLTEAQMAFMQGDRDGERPLREQAQDLQDLLVLIRRDLDEVRGEWAAVQAVFNAKLAVYYEKKRALQAVRHWRQKRKVARDRAAVAAMAELHPAFARVLALHGGAVLVGWRTKTVMDVYVGGREKPDGPGHGHYIFEVDKGRQCYGRAPKLACELVAVG